MDHQSEGLAIQVYARVRPPAVKTHGVGGDGGAGDAHVLQPTAKGNHATPGKGKPPAKGRAPESAAKAATPAAAAKLNVTGMRLNPQEGPLGLPTVIQFDLADGASLDETASVHKETAFDMDAVFPPHVDQRTVFEVIGAQHVQSVVEGFNSTVFAYGRTCSGKTHTIVGPAAQRYGSSWTFGELEEEEGDAGAQPSLLGLVPRCLHGLLHRIKELGAQRHFTLRFACAEIYNQKLYDLCAGPCADGGAERAEIAGGRMTTSAADKISWHEIDVRPGAEDEAMVRAQALICRANAARVSASTSANVDSSRSHVLYLARVASVGRDGDCKEAMLSIVDLAGSESLDPQRDKAAPGSASRDHETRSINSSLHTLTRVVQAYASAPPGGKPLHVPYRESLLTLLLKDSIGGNCMTSIIVALSGDEEQVAHSYKSCQFARLARGVRNVVKENKTYDPGNVIASLRAKVAELQEGLAVRDAAITAESALGPRLASLLALAPSPDFPTDRLMDVVAEWVDAVPPTGEEEGDGAEEGGYTTRLRSLAALSVAVREFVRTTGVPTLVDEPWVYDMAVGTSPLPPPTPAPVAQHRGNGSDTSTGACVQGGSPTLLRRQDMSSAVDARAIRASVLLRMVTESEAWVDRARAALLPSLRCAAGVLDARMAALGGCGMGVGVGARAPPVPPARLTMSAAEDDPVMLAQRDYARVHARIATLQAEVDAADGRLGALRQLLEDGQSEAARSSVGSTACVATSSIPVHEGAAGRLPAGATYEWQVRSDADDAWEPLQDDVSAALQAVVEATGPPSCVLATSSGVLSTRPSEGVPACPLLPAPVPLLAACGAEEGELLASAAFPTSSVRSFAGDVVYRLHSGGSSGVMKCTTTGAVRALRRAVHVLLQGDLLKQCRWTGQWVPRTMRLLPAALVQLYEAESRRKARTLIQREFAAGPASALRNALAKASIDKVKARFDEGAVVATLKATEENEGREFTLHVSAARGGAAPSSSSSASAYTQAFRAASAQEAWTWVHSINAAGGGAHLPTLPAASAAVPAVTSVSLPSHAAVRGSVLTILDGVVAARVKEAATRALRLSFDSDALLGLTTPLVPPARSLGLLSKELGLPWSPGVGESPCGTPVLLTVSPDSSEWSALMDVEGVARDDEGSRAGWRVAGAALLALPSNESPAMVGVRARVRRVLRVQNAVLAQRFLGLCAEHRYRAGRKAVGMGHAFAAPDSTGQLNALLATGGVDGDALPLACASASSPSPLSASMGEAVGGAYSAWAGRLHHDRAGGLQGLLPVVVFRVAYGTGGGVGATRGGGLPFSPAPVRNLAGSWTEGHAAAAAPPAPVVAPPPAGPPAAPTCVQSALARPASVLALYPAYVLMLSLETTGA